MEAKKGCSDHTVPESPPWIEGCLSWGGVRGVWWGCPEPALPPSVTLLVPRRCPTCWQPCRLETAGRKPASLLPAPSLASSLTSTPPSCLPRQGPSIGRTRRPSLTTGTRVGGTTPWPAPAQLRIGGRLCPAISHLCKLWTSPKETCKFGLCWQFSPPARTDGRHGDACLSFPNTPL